MPSASEDRFRQSWKLQELSGKPAQTWLVIRRIVATLLALGLIGVCGWLIFSLFWVPKSYVAYWSANAYQPLAAAPVKYACNDFAAIESLKDAFAGTNLVNPAEEKLTKEALENNLRELSSMGMRSKDACIVFLTAHGVVRNKEPFLLSEPGGQKSEIPVADVLTALKNVQAGTKLLILDAGRDERSQSAGGVGSGTFAALLETAVAAADDPALWVLTANGPLERSHVSADWNRPVFGYMVSQGLRGAADRNHDGVIQLDELYSFVQSGVASWVKLATGGAESQTPRLIHFDGGKRSSEQVASRRLANAKVLAAEPEHAVEHVDEHEQEDEGSGISKWLAERREEAKERFSLKEDIHIFSHILGIHGHEGGEAEGHGEHAAGASSEHAANEAEHKNEAHDAKAEARAETAAAARKQVKDAWLAAARLEADDGRLSPAVVAPPLWRELVERLLWCDEFCASGVPAEAKASWKQVSKELLGIDQSLQAFVAYRLPPRVDAPADQPISLAMADRLAQSDPKSRLPNVLSDFLAKYDRLLLEEPPATFKDKLNGLLAGQKTDLGLANYYELQLIAPGRELNKDPDISSAALQLLLKARRIGESVAANPLCGEGWARDGIEAADRSRAEGERQLFDRTSSNWEKQATDRLTAAMDGYESTFRNLDFVRETIQYRDALLLRAPGLVQRACLNGGDHQEITAVQKVFSTVQDLNKALVDPAQTNIDVLKRMRDQVESASAALKRKTDPTNDGWRITNLLATSLPTPEERTKLSEELVAAEKHQMVDFKLPDTETEAANAPPLSEEQWKRAVDEFALQADLARLAGCNEAALTKLTKSLEVQGTERIEKLNEARGQLASLLDKVPAAVEAPTNSGNDRAAQLAQLRAAFPQWLLLGAELRDRIDAKNNLITRLDRVSWHDLLAWNSERFRNAADDAPVANGPFLAKMSATFHDLANSVPDEPPIPQINAPVLSIESPEQVSLVAFDEATVRFTVKSSASEEKPVWLTAQYNDKWLDVDQNVYHQHELPAALAAKNLGEKASHLPLRPDALGLPEKDRIPAGGARDYTVKIRRQANTDAGGAAKLILKAVSGDTFVRREVAVDLPGRESLDIAVNAAPEFWTPANHTLHPLPNHVQSFTFDVVNRAKVAKKLEVSFRAPTTLPTKSDLVALPTGPQKADVAAKLLDAYGPPVRLGPSFPVDLPASGESVRIKMPGGDPKVDPKANLLLPEKGDPEQFPGIQLRYGLMILLTDPATKEVTIRRIEIAPQRPTGYLQAVADYDQRTGELAIVVSAKNPDVIPSEGLQISADVTGVSAQLPQSLKADLKGPSYKAKLTAVISQTADAEITANVNVNDYPRAFVFRFPRTTPQRTLAPATNLAEVRIVSPPAGKAFKAPAENLDVVAEVDAPEGTFGEGDSTSRVEFGVDENQDRDLQGEPLETRYADRDVSVFAKSLLPDGSLGLNTRVGDFHLNLRSYQTNRRVSLLGRLVVNGKPKPSQPVEILIDGSAPVIHAALPPNREVETEDDLIVQVLQRPNEIDLSGVKKVEAVFDSVATKDTPGAKPAKWEEGVPDGPDRWKVTLPTKGMGLGPQTVLVRATDKVGNESQPLREPVTIVAKKPKQAVPAANQAPPKPDLANIVSGKVEYGNDAAKANVSLESFVGPQVPAVVSDTSGKFTFPKVPPGKYTLKAKTPDPIHNRFRTAEMEITVEPKPKAQPPVAVKLQ